MESLQLIQSIPTTDQTPYTVFEMQLGTDLTMMKDKDLYFFMCFTRCCFVYKYW
jgi:hypothetical protein